MPSLVAKEAEPAIIVDFASSCELKVKQSLYSCKLPGLLWWQQTKKSLGSTMEIQRSQIVGTFNPSIISDLELRLYMMQIRAILGEALHEPVLIGNRNLFGNRSAILVDFTSIQAIIDNSSKLLEVVVCSSKLAVVLTGTTPEIWSEVMTATALTNPSVSIEKMRHRMSHNGGRPFAKIQILDQEAREKKAQANTGKMNAKEQEYRKLQVPLSIQGLASAGRTDLANEIMQVVVDSLSGIPVIKAFQRLEKEWRLSDTSIARRLTEQHWS